MQQPLLATDALAQVGMAVEHGSLLGREDPVAGFTTVAPDGTEYEQQRRLLQNVLAGIECFFCGGNQIGKTTIIAYLWAALAQGKRYFCGMELPFFRQPSVWWILCQTREQQVESTQAKLLEALGDWPHEIKYATGFPDAAVLIRVKPIGGPDDPRRWSKIWFHVEGSAKNTLPGGRIDGAWADEPPVMARWREVRFRGKNNRLFLLVITATPISSKLWRPLKRDFDGCDNEPSGGRLRIVATVFDNPFMSATHRAQLLERAKNDPHEAARIYGTYVDETGSCPFRREHLDRWRARCRDPELIEEQVMMEQETPEGRIYIPVMVKWEKFYDIEPDEVCYCPIDPSLGIRDPAHDPGGIHIYSRVRPRLVGRYHDYLEPYALGQLAGLMMLHLKKWEEGEIDVEMNDGMGDSVIRGARSVGHSKFQFDLHDNQTTGIVDTRIGWRTTPSNRGLFIGAAQRVVSNDEVLCHSESLVSNLGAVIVNRFYRIEAVEGEHDEDMILLGRFAYISQLKGVPKVRIPTFEEQFMAQVGQRVTIDINQLRDGASGMPYEHRPDFTPDEVAKDWGPGQ